VVAAVVLSGAAFVICGKVASGGVSAASAGRATSAAKTTSVSGVKIFGI